MTRLFYGGSGGDVIAAVGSGDGDYEPTTATFDVYDAQTGGTAITDLQDKDGTPITDIDPDAEGRVQFYGEDGYAGSYWLEDQANPGSDRWLVEPAGLGDRVADIEAVDLGSFYAKPGSGIPATDLETAAQDLLNGAVQESVATAAGDVLVGTAADTVDVFPAQPDMLFGWDSSGDPEGVDPTDFATKAGTMQQFSDWDDSSPSDGNVPVWDAGSGSYVPTDLTASFATLGSDGRLASGEEPLWYEPIAVVNEGDPPPSGFPVGGIIFSRPAAASIVPLSIGSNYAQGPDNVVVTTTDDVAVGDWIVLDVGTSGEVTLPSTYTVALSAGAASGGWSSAVEAHQTGSAQTNILYAKCTTAIPAGSTITVTANQNRAHIMCVATKIPNLVGSSVLDQTVGNQGSSNTTLAKQVGPTGATAQANEVALCAVTYNSGSGTTVRTVAGQNGWAQVGTQIDSDTGASGRGTLLLYKVLSATGTVTADLLWTTTDGATGAWAGVIATFKAA